MTNQNQPGQPNQPSGRRPGQEHDGGQKPGQQSQAPDKNPKEPYDQTSDTDT
jgi:hypothetical protein